MSRAVGEAVHDERRSERRGRLAILVAAVAWSTAGLGQRELEVSPATQVAGRALFAAAALLVVVWVTERGNVWGSFRAIGRWGVAATLFLAVSSGTFMLALNHTTVANVLFMQAAAPMMAALLGWWLLSEPVSSRTWAGMALAAVGVSLMVVGSVSGGLLAFVLPFVMTASFAAVIVIARHRREVSLMPATCASQVLLVVLVAPFASFASATRADWTILAALGICQIGLGLALLTVAARLIPPAEVALISLLEIVLGPLWVWLAYDEVPAATTLAGGAIVAVAVVLQATADVRAAPRPVSEAA
ncbi:MAG TPA: DMT family transporter [Gaiellaceae bacterium]|nr:DMT family transporter [Gaiellaceae bacterium]